MHVIIISDFGHVSGGAAKVAIDGAIGLAQRGHNVTFVYAIDPIDERLHQEAITLAHIPLQDVWTNTNALNAARLAIWNDGAKNALESALRPVIGPDSVAHIHQWSKAFSPSVFRALNRLGVPILVSMHDYFSVCPNGAYYQFGQREPCTLKPMGGACIASNCDRVSRRHKMVRLLRHRRLAAEFDRISNLTFVHVSEMAQNVAIPLSPDHAEHTVIHNPVSPLEGPPTLPWGNEHVLFAGRLTLEKGVMELAEAARRMSVPCAFLGQGPAEADLKERYPEHRYVPWGSQETVSDAVRASRAVVLPSLWYETFGLIVLEALSIGVPVIVSDTVGAKTFVLDDVNGFITPRGDITVLGDRLAQVMDNTVLKRLAEGARNNTPFDRLGLMGHTDALEIAYQRSASRADG